MIDSGQRVFDNGQCGAHEKNYVPVKKFIYSFNLNKFSKLTVTIVGVGF